MSKIDEMIAELCPNGVEYKRLGDIASYANEKIDLANIDTNSYTSVENLKKDYGGRISPESIPSSGKCTEVKPNDLLLGNIRPNLKKAWLSDCQGGASNDVLVIRINNDKSILPQFLYQLITSDRFSRYSIQHMRGAKMPRGDKAKILDFELPIPPIEVQKEIVKVLDKFAELEARKTQYAYYRDKLLSFERERE